MSAMTSKQFLPMFCEAESSISVERKHVHFSAALSMSQSNFEKHEGYFSKLLSVCHKRWKAEKCRLVKYFYSHVLSEMGHISGACKMPEQQLQVAQQHTS